MQMNKETMQIIYNYKLLGDKSGAEEDIQERVMVRRNKKKKNGKKATLSGIL